MNYMALIIGTISVLANTLSNENCCKIYFSPSVQQCMQDDMAKKPTCS